MNIQERIEALEHRIQMEQEKSEYELQHLKSDLEVLKAEVSAPKKFEMWVPENCTQYFFPAPGGYNYRGTIRFTDGDMAVPRGLAFQTEADAAEVGKYLAVIGKLCNLAKQLNTKRVYTTYSFAIGPDNHGSLVVYECKPYGSPRFHSRDAAETALGLLTPEERDVLVRGIS